MTLTRSLMLSSAIAFVTAAPAFADLTAEQVIADQLSKMELHGLTAKVTDQSRSGDTITVEELWASGDIEGGSFRVTMGGASFREVGDGTVEVSYPDSIPITVSFTSPDGETVELALSVSQTNSKMIASGIPEEMRYDFTSDSFTLGDIEITGPEEAIEEIDFDMSFQLTGISGVMIWIGGGTVRDYTADFNVAGMSMTFTDAAEGEGDFSLAMEAQNIVADYEGSAAPQELMASLAQVVEAGNKTKGTASHGPLTYTVSGDGPDGSFEMAAAVASGEFEFDLGRNGLSYGAVSEDITLSVGGSMIPLPPLTFKMAESGTNFGMPIVPSEEPQGFALGMNFAGLEIDDMLWGMIDPTGQLPRDPATLVIDLGGEVTMKQDVFDPEVVENLTEAPGEINSVSINQILLTLAGAELTGDGAFTFNNSGPVPVPAGTVNMMLQGGNGLLDTLVGMGLVPEDQAMGARMMLGMFARPGTGPDTLVSTIEMKEDGSVLANGQRIR